MPTKQILFDGTVLKGLRLYRIWLKMKSRCSNPKDDRFKYYGAKGVKVCAMWLNNFHAFYKWAINNGYNDTLTLDRRNPNGNYNPINCRWISHADQQKNKRKKIVDSQK